MCVSCVIFWPRLTSVTSWKFCKSTLKKKLSEFCFFIFSEFLCFLFLVSFVSYLMRGIFVIWARVKCPSYPPIKIFGGHHNPNTKFKGRHCKNWNIGEHCKDCYSLTGISLVSPWKYNLVTYLHVGAHINSISYI